MSEKNDRLPMPAWPCRTVVDASGIVATVRTGSMAEYLDAMETWLLQELKAVSGEERKDAEEALNAIRRSRQALAKKPGASAEQSS